MLKALRYYSLTTGLIALLLSVFWNYIFGPGLWLEMCLFLVPQAVLTVAVSYLVSKKIPSNLWVTALVLEMIKAVMFWVALGWAWLHVPWYS